MSNFVDHDATVVTMDRDHRILERGTIRVTDDTITAVEPAAADDPSATADCVVDAEGTVAMPGLIDADTPRLRPYSNLPSVLTNSVTAGDVGTVIVDGDVLLRDGTVETIDVEDVYETAERERDRLRTELGWETSLAGSSPPETSILRRVSTRPLVRALEQYGRGFVAEHFP